MFNTYMAVCHLFRGGSRLGLNIWETKENVSQHRTQRCSFKKKSNNWKHKPGLRGAGRDRCFPEPFPCFLHETGLENLKTTYARCFWLKCQRKASKKAKEHRQFRGVLGRWRIAAIDRTTFHACQRCRKTAVSQFVSRSLHTPHGGKLPASLMEKKSRPDAHSNQMDYTLSLREGLVAIERERKRRPGLAFSLKSNNTDRPKKI